MATSSNPALQGRITRAYELFIGELRRVRGDQSLQWVLLSDVFGHMDVPKREFDKVILEMVLKLEVADIEPEVNGKTLEPRDRAASVRMGGEDCHLFKIFGL